MKDTPNRDVAIFTEAAGLADAERAAFLERACGDDSELRQRVEALLQAHNRAGDFLEQFPPKPTVEARLRAFNSEKPGDWIGRYKLLQQIGEGGCGAVYMAEQEEPVRRRVALKIIKPGMDTKSVIARFEAERQALALMDHPNIAKVFDAGATESGRPYFVMELIRGVKITEYCDQNSLATEERLKLFVQVCQAVQHAHQKGVIHRDIKPSNILVTRNLEGVALPVVIDFGIAKATTNQRLTDKTLFTAFEMLIGTPAYMSPEQAALTSVEVDTRTDIYSLGVLLYELLTGLTPFDAGELLKSGLDEIRRVIREQEPVSPSTRLSRLTDADLTTVAQHRHADPPMLIRAVRGDLDWIVMKALEKDRTRRYATANGLALDVQRFLANETVLARPPSTLYKFQKMMLRNKLLFSGIGVIMVLLVTSLIIVSASLARERQARRKAETEAVKSRQVTQFLEEMLQGVGPSVARGRDTVMMREILDRTAKSVGNGMTNQPVVEAELRSVIGQLYQQIGNYDGAEKMHSVATDINRKLFGSKSPEVAASLNDLGLALFKEGNLAEAENAIAEALRIRRQLLGGENADVAASLNDLAVIYRHQRRLTDSESLSRESIGIRQKLFSKDSLEVADSLHNLAIVLSDEGKKTESEATARELLAMRRELLGPEDPLIAAALQDLAYVMGMNGKSAESKSLQQEALAMQRKLLGDAHPDVSISLSTLGERLRQQGNLGDAHVVLSSALSIQRKLLGDDSPAVLYSLGRLGLTLEQEGKWPEAEAAHREALTGWRKQFGIQDPQPLKELSGLARALTAQKKYGEAEKVLGEALTPAFVREPASADLLLLRVDLLGRQVRWHEAAADAALLLQLQPNEHYHYHRLAGLLAMTHDLPAYEQLCQKILTTFGHATNEYVAERMADDCLLLPHSGVDLQLVDRLADAAVTIGSNDVGALTYFQACKALSDYRLGHFSEAIKWAENPLNSSYADANSRAKACAVLAMAHWQLNQKNEARAMLAKGNELAPGILPARSDEDLGASWVAWLFARLSLDEATALIQPASATRQK
jgi:serine/threonine protein kinase/tetratricopeptide (TPR) repeat protein